MPDLDWNKAVWDGSYDWGKGGEEWSGPWGDSEAQWFGALYPRLHRLLPAGRILEIAPGFGRWTRFLIPACSGYLGVDLSGACVDACRNRFARAPHARFVQNDGLSLAAVPDLSFDFVFSFDALVHAEFDVFQNYIPELLRKLTPNGVAFLHHSNLQDVTLPEDVSALGRARSVCGRTIAELVQQSGGNVMVQEVINWCSPYLLDCLTAFRRADGVGDAETTYRVNPRFMDEAAMIARFQHPYCKLR